MKPRETRCKRVVDVAGVGLNPTRRYWCYGTLTRVERKRQAVTPQQKLEHAHAQLADAITKVKRATTSVGLWQRRVKYYERVLAEQARPRDAGGRAIVVEG